MNEINREKRWKNIFFFIGLAVLFLELLTFCLVTFSGMVTQAGEDVYGDALVARLIWEEKTLFPKSWIFGNQYNVISTPVLAALFYGITGSMNLGLSLACMVMNIFIVLAFWWALAPFCSRQQILTGLITLLGCVICNPAYPLWEGHYLYIKANYYACYLIVMLVVWGDWLRLVTGKRKKLFCPSFLLSLFLCFAIGMQSIRQFAVMILPMAAVDLLRLLFLILRKGFHLKKEDFLPTAAVILCGSFNLLGLQYVKSLHLPHVNISFERGLQPKGQWIANLKSALLETSKITGLHNLITAADRTSPVFWLSCLLWLTLVIVTVTALVLILMDLIRKKDLTDHPMDILVLLLAVSFAGVMASFILIKIDIRSVYLFVWFPLTAASALSVYGRIKGKGKAGLMVLLFVLCLNNMVYTYSPPLKSSRYMNQAFQETSDWIIAHDYDYVYGNVHKVGKLMPYGDGAYIAGFWSQRPFQILGYTNISNIYEEEHNARAVYFVSTPDAEAVEACVRENDLPLNLVFTSSDGSCKLYTSPRQLMHPLQ